MVWRQFSKTPGNKITGRFAGEIEWLRLDGLGQLGQAGDFARGGAFVQNPFLGGLGNLRLSRLETLYGRFGRFFSGGLTNLFDHIFHTGFDRSIA
jgi:hypothetical protein